MSRLGALVALLLAPLVTSCDGLACVNVQHAERLTGRYDVVDHGGLWVWDGQVVGVDWDRGGDFWFCSAPQDWRLGAAFEVAR